MGRVEAIAATMGDREFSRAEFLDAAKAALPKLSDSSRSAMLQKAVKLGDVVRIERNKYCFAGSASAKQVYLHEYTAASESVAETLGGTFDGLDFRIFELIQLNEFLNHQVAHNIVFASVEKDLEDFAFDALRERFRGRVLYEPSEDDCQRYWEDGMVVVQGLVSETPKGVGRVWHAQPEKFLVDMLSDRLLKSMVPQSELRGVGRAVVGAYRVNMPRLFRYARRRGVFEEAEALLGEALPDEGRFAQNAGHSAREEA